MTTLLVKIMSTGKTLEVLYTGHLGRVSCILDGDKLDDAYINKLHTPQGDITHYIATIPKIGLTKAEADTIHAAQAEMKAADPNTQRAAILEKMRSALDSYDYHTHKDDGGTGLRFADAAKYENAYQASKKELVEFDAAHPELVKDIADKKAAELEIAKKAMWNN